MRAPRERENVISAMADLSPVQNFGVKYLENASSEKGGTTAIRLSDPKSIDLGGFDFSPEFPFKA